MTNYHKKACLESAITSKEVILVEGSKISLQTENEQIKKRKGEKWK